VVLRKWIPVAGQNLASSRAYLKKNNAHVGRQRYQHHFEKFLCGKTQAGEPKQNIDRVPALYFDLPQARFSGICTLATLVILLDGRYEFWRTSPVTGLEFLVVESGIAATFYSHKPWPFWFLLGTGLGRYLN